MRIDHSLDDLFATGSHVRVLRALATLPGSVGASGREIARRAGVSAPTARDALASLVDQGVVRVTRSLGTTAYQLEAEHVLFPLVRDMFARERSVRGDLEHDLGGALARLGDVESAYLFGSAARGDMLPHSDIDVAVAGVVPEQSDDLERLRRRYGNPISVTRLRSRAGAALRERVMAEGRPIPLPRSR